MFINVIIILASVFVAYNLILFLFPLKKKEFFTNKERAEEYIYSKGKYQVVFAGSGLTGHLINTGNNNAFNLFLPYSGACTAVEIVARAPKKPKVLLVEVNYIFKGYDKELINSLYSPIKYWLKLFLPALQNKHQFLSIVKAMMKVFWGEKVVSESKFKGLDYQQLEMFRYFYNQPPKKELLSNDIESLKQHVDKLSSKKCTVIFFEMPLEESISDSVLMKYQKTELKKTFPADKFYWIEPSPSDAYYTEDGIHLSEKSALQYSNYLYASLQKLLATRKDCFHST